VVPILRQRPDWMAVKVPSPVLPIISASPVLPDAEPVGGDPVAFRPMLLGVLIYWYGYRATTWPARAQTSRPRPRDRSPAPDHAAALPPHSAHHAWSGGAQHAPPDH
jgi:hypothetical protein